MEPINNQIEQLVWTRANDNLRNNLRKMVRINPKSVSQMWQRYNQTREQIWWEIKEHVEEQVRCQILN